MRCQNKQLERDSIQSDRNHALNHELPLSHPLLLKALSTDYLHSVENLYFHIMRYAFPFFDISFVNGDILTGISSKSVLFASLKSREKKKQAAIAVPQERDAA